ncbi:MAG: glycosyltransferase [Lentisphaerae bacterium]|nr:glycosyltransferase [Lentisphaerota bacterium]
MLSVVIPCCNEAFRLEPLCALIDGAAGRGWEWLLVDDGSRDGTGGLLESFAARSRSRVRLLRHERNRGKGAAVRTGVLASQGDLVGYVDADLAASPLDFAAWLDDDGLRAGRELLVGIRLLTQERLVERRLWRHLLGRVYLTYVSCVTGLTVYDTQCGFKLLSGERARRLFEPLGCAGFAFDTELILRALGAGMRIREVPVAWQERGRSRVRPWNALRMAVDIVAIRARLAREGRG